MKRTLLAVGVAVLISMMFVPSVRYVVGTSWDGHREMGIVPGNVRPFFSLADCRVLWGPFALQTAFAAVAAAVIVNLFQRKK
jgi:uncharacterized protein (DUF2062 family)